MTLTNFNLFLRSVCQEFATPIALSTNAPSLMQRQEVKSIVKGYARKLEITYNEERDDYHPHFHVLIAVNKSYFTDTKQYINRDRWLEVWQQVTKNPLITQVDVRKVRNGRNDKVYEIAKYSAKDCEYLINQDVFEAFYNALKGK